LDEEYVLSFLIEGIEDLDEDFAIFLELCFLGIVFLYFWIGFDLSWNSLEQGRLSAMKTVSFNRSSYSSSSLSQKKGLILSFKTSYSLFS